MAQRAPRPLALAHRRDGTRGAPDAAHALDRGVLLQVEVVGTAHRQRQRQVAVGAERVDGQLHHRRRPGRGLRVGQRDVDLGADVAAARPALARRLRHDARQPARGEERVRIGAGVVVARIERLELAHLLHARLVDARHRQQGEHLVVHRPGAVADHVELVVARVHLDAVGALLEQVDGRRAVQREVARIERLLQRDVAAVGDEQQLEFRRADLGDELAQPLDAREQVARRERPVFLEQAVAGKRAILDRQQGLVVAEAAGHERIGAEDAGQRVAAQRIDDRDGLAAREQLLVDPVRDAVVAGHVQHEFVELQLVGQQRGPHAQAHAQARVGRDEAGQRRGGHVGDVRLEARLRDPQRPQAHALAGGEAARRALARLQARAHHAAARHQRAGGQRGVVEVGLELRDEHRRRGRQVARVDQLQQVLREARVLGVLLVVHAAGEEREAFEQALHVGVDAFAAGRGLFQREPGRDLRMLARELRRGVADVQQFLPVVAE